MAKKTRKHLLGAGFYFAVLALTLWYVFQDENLGQVAELVTQANPGWIAVSGAAVVAFILGQSVVLCYLLRSLGTQTRLEHCCLFSFVGFFYNAITPSASGGQPFQVMYMHRAGIPAAVSTVVLVIVTILYKLVLLALGLTVLILWPGRIMQCLSGVEALIYIGLGLNVTAIWLLFTAVFRPQILERFADWILRVGQKLRFFRDPQKVMERVQSLLTQYRGTAEFFRRKPKIIFIAFVLTAFQRICMFSVAWCVYRAFNLSGDSVITVLVLQGLISLAADMLPLPGGMGVSETLFTVIFAPVFGESLVLPGMVLCRGISYYTQLLISAAMSMVTHCVFRKKEAQEK